MWTLSFKSITIFILVSTAWWFGGHELYHTITNFGTQWHWYLLATIYTATLNEVFNHIIMTHKLFEANVKSWTYRVLVFLLSVDHGSGPVTGMCMSHPRHHTHPDQGNKDVINWRIHWFTNGVVSPLNAIYQAPTDYGDVDSYVKEQESKYKEVFDDLWTFFVEEWSHVLTIVYWLVLYLVAPVILFKVVFMGRVLLSIYNGFGNIFGHTKIPFGYRNFNTADQTHNNIWCNILSCMMIPTIQQNNHHGTPYTLEKGMAVHWYEHDFSKYIARFLKLFMEKK